jgi:hypothetical protein
MKKLKSRMDNFLDTRLARIAVSCMLVATMYYLGAHDPGVRPFYWPAAAIILIQGLKSPQTLQNAERRGAIIIAGLALCMSSLVHSPATLAAFVMLTGGSLGALWDVRKDWLEVIHRYRSMR